MPYRLPYHTSNLEASVFAINKKLNKTLPNMHQNMPRVFDRAMKNLVPNDNNNNNSVIRHIVIVRILRAVPFPPTHTDFFANPMAMIGSISESNHLEITESSSIFCTRVKKRIKYKKS